MKAGLLPLLALILLLPATFGCDSPTPPSPPSPTPGAQLAGGLGLTRAEWEQRHKLILTIPDFDYIYDGYNPPLFGYRVNYWQAAGSNDPTSRISVISVDTRLVLSDTGHMAPTAAGIATLTKPQIEDAVHSLLPSDANLHDTQEPNAESTFTETYRSKLIENIYPPIGSLKDPWGTDPEGTIQVVYANGGPSVLITAGREGHPPGSSLKILPTMTPGH